MKKFAIIVIILSIFRSDLIGQTGEIKTSGTTSTPVISLSREEQMLRAKKTFAFLNTKVSRYRKPKEQKLKPSKKKRRRGRKLPKIVFNRRIFDAFCQRLTDSYGIYISTTIYKRFLKDIYNKRKPLTLHTIITAYHAADILQQRWGELPLCLQLIDKILQYLPPNEVRDFWGVATSLSGELILSNKEYTDKMIEDLINSGLLGPMSNIRVLNLEKALQKIETKQSSYPRYRVGFTIKSLKQLFIHGALSHVKELQLYQLPMQDSSGDEVGWTLKDDMKHLKKYQSFGLLIAKVLAQSMRSNRLNNLEVLSLAAKCIGPEGARILFKSFADKKHHSLKRLNLSRNGIGDIGAEALAKMLPYQKNLKHLCLELNCLNPKSGVAIASAITKMKKPSLVYLSLYANQIGLEGADAFIALIRSGKLDNLENLYLSFNYCGKKGQALILKALKESKIALNKKYIPIDYDPID